MRVLLHVTVEFDAEKLGVDSLCDAQHAARAAAIIELQKDEEEDPEVEYVILENS